MSRTSHPLHANVSGVEVETRIRCLDDGHLPGCFNPSLGVTFCHCGRVRYPGLVAADPWPDRQARLTAHVPCGHWVEVA